MSLIVAGAALFCQAFAHPLCEARPEPAPIVLGEAQRQALEETAGDLARGYDGASEWRNAVGRDSNRPPEDVWRIDPRGDCEDRMLAVFLSLSPELQRAARPALIIMGREGRGDVYAHIVLEIVTSEGSVFLDPEHRHSQTPRRYRTRDRYAPEGSIGGRWRRVD